MDSRGERQESAQFQAVAADSRAVHEEQEHLQESGSMRPVPQG